MCHSNCRQTQLHILNLKCRFRVRWCELLFYPVVILLIFTRNMQNESFTCIQLTVFGRIAQHLLNYSRAYLPMYALHGSLAFIQSIVYSTQIILWCKLYVNSLAFSIFIQTHLLLETHHFQFLYSYVQYLHFPFTVFFTGRPGFPQFGGSSFKFILSHMNTLTINSIKQVILLPVRFSFPMQLIKNYHIGSLVMQLTFLDPFFQ